MQMATFVIMLIGLEYFRIHFGPISKEVCTVSAKFNLGTRCRLHNSCEHFTCTPSRKDSLEAAALGSAIRVRINRSFFAHLHFSHFLGVIIIVVATRANSRVTNQSRK